jgi:hypothetical protein
MIAKTVDSKGRINLGKRFANKTFIVTEINATEVKLELARVIPEREAWLYKSDKARASVARGLAQAKARTFSQSPPDLNADQTLIDELED